MGLGFVLAEAEEFSGEWAEQIFYSGLLWIGLDYFGSVRTAAEHEDV